MMAIDNNIQILETKIQAAESTLKAQKQAGGVSGKELTIESLDRLVTVPDPYSQKIIALVAKHNALEDCMAAIKKGYEKDAVSIEDFLKQVRALAVKQCKQLQKLKKIDDAMNGGQHQKFTGYA